MRFKLQSEYQPKGDQPAAIDAIVRGLSDGAKDQVLLGITGSGKTFTIASVIERTQRSTLVLAHNKTLAAQLQTALSTRAVIDQAIGLIRGRTGRDAEDAFAQLQAISHTEHCRLADVAQHVVDEAVRRAHARQSHT